MSFIGIANNIWRNTRGTGGNTLISPVAFYDLSVISSLFQDVAMTIPVTAVDDPIEAIKDLSGSGHHMLLTVGTAPLYKNSGGISWAEFNGVNDLLATSFAWVQPLTRMVAIRLLAAADNLFINEGDAEKLQLRIAGTGAVFMNDGDASGNVMIGTLTVGNDFVVTEEWNGASSNGQLNDGAVTNVTAGASPANEWNLGARANATGAVNMRFYGGFGFAQVLPAAQKAIRKAQLSALF